VRENIESIVHVECGTVTKRLKEKGICLRFENSALEFLIEKGYSKDFGARPLRRAIERHVEDELSEMLLRGTMLNCSEVIISHEGEDKLKFNPVKNITLEVPAAIPASL
jgi:ATP-dependent Clp protease ATP-binding subunit ClpC